MMLIIGYGNVLRGDDGVGPLVAEKMMGVVGLECMPRHQLLPELAQPVSEAERVVFVDASVEGRPGEVACRPIRPDEKALMGTAHALSPEGVLALAKLLYGRVPPAYLLTLTGFAFEHTAELSPEMGSAVDAAIVRVRELMAQRQSVSIE